MARRCVTLNARRAVARDEGVVLSHDRSTRCTDIGWCLRHRAGCARALAEAGHRVLTLDIDVEPLRNFKMNLARAARWSATCRMRHRSRRPLIPWSTPTSALMCYLTTRALRAPATGGRHRGSGVAVDDRYRFNSVFYLTRLVIPRNPAQRPDPEYVFQCRAVRLPNALPLRGG